MDQSTPGSTAIGIRLSRKRARLRPQMNNTPTALASAQLETIQNMYAAFGRGDIPTLLSHVADEVDWRLNVDPSAPGASRIPDFRPFRGKEGVQAFFSIIGADLELHSFQPLSFLTGANEVVARLEMDLTVRSTGRRSRLESLHYFAFDADGRVKRFVEYLDTLAVAAGWDAIEAKA